MVKDKTVVLTGTFEKIKRTEAVTRLRSLGAKISSGVSAKTDILFAGDRAGAKLAKAEALGVLILGESELIEALNEIIPAHSGSTESETLSLVPEQHTTTPKKTTAPSPTLPCWAEVPFTLPPPPLDIPKVSKRTQLFSHLCQHMIPNRAAEALPIGDGLTLWFDSNGLYLYRQRGERLILLDYLERGGRKMVFASEFGVIGLLSNKDELHLVSLKGERLHYNRRMKLSTVLLDDWRDTELSNENGQIIIRSKAHAEIQKQWVLDHLEVVSAKHQVEREWKKAIKELEKSVKADQGLGFVPMDHLISMPNFTLPTLISPGTDGELHWTGSKGETWIFTPYYGDRYPKAIHGTYLLIYQHTDGHRVEIDLGVTEGILDGYPRLCGHHYSRLGIGYDRVKRVEIEKWDNREELIDAIMDITQDALSKGFHATVYEEGRNALIYSALSDTAFDVNLITGQSQPICLGETPYGANNKGRIQEIEVRHNRQFFLRFENSLSSGHLDHPIELKTVAGRSYRLYDDIFALYSADDQSMVAKLEFFLTWDMPTYEGVQWVGQEQIPCRYLIPWKSFSLPCGGLDLVFDGETLYAVNEKHSFKFIGLSQAIGFLRTSWIGADQETSHVPDGGWEIH